MKILIRRIMWKRQHIPDSVQKTCIHLQMITLLSVAEWQCGAYESHLQKIFFRSTKKRRQAQETSINVLYSKTMTLSNWCH